MNVMINLININKIRNEADLKKVYHKLILQKHPDLNSSRNSQEEFIKLQDWYLEAKQELKLKKSVKYDDQKIESILDAFYELISLNYPFRVIQHKNYSRRVEIIKNYYTNNSNNEYSKVEIEFTIITKNDILYVSECNHIKNYFYLLQAFYYNPLKHIKLSIENENKIIEKLLEKNKMYSTKEFLIWLYQRTLEVKEHPTTAST